jgi:nitrous oxidase accessory protein
MGVKPKKIILISLFLIFFLILSCGCIEYQKEKQDIKELNLQEIINQAKLGDTILLDSKTYFESIQINKKLTIVGMQDSTIIDGNGSEDVISIESEGVKLKNIIVRNSGGNKENSGIKIETNNNVIENCMVYRTKIGIYFDNSNDNKILNSYFHTNGDGVYFYKSNKNTIESSEFQHNAFGINLHESDNIDIENSYIHTNGLGIYCRDIDGLKITKCAISDQNQDGGGCWIFDSSNIKINNCNLEHNGAGIKIQNTDAKITNSNFDFNMFITIHLIDSENVEITNCNINNGYRTGFKVLNSKCQINNNNIRNFILNAFESDKNSNCDIRNNYWGNRFGPSLTEFGKGEKIKYRIVKVRVFPWAKEIYEDIGSDWETNDVFRKTKYNPERFKALSFKEKDSDNDGAPDWWEDKWGYDKQKIEDHANLDPDKDELNNLEECFTDKYDSDPFKKDIFIEVDWLKSYEGEESSKLSQEYISQAEEIFRDQDINLHIDVGELGGGEEIPLTETKSFADLIDLYWDYFLDNKLDNPRKGIFHYMLIMNENPETYAGFVFVGWDHLDSMSLCIQPMQDNRKMDRSKLIIYGIIHELGHQMGLLIDDFGGIDNTGSTKPLTLQFFKYRNYKSVLNYQKYLNILSYSDGSNGKNDFDDWANLDFSFFKETDFELKNY